jgi:hypothetical protein
LRGTSSYSRRVCQKALWDGILDSMRSIDFLNASEHIAEGLRLCPVEFPKVKALLHLLLLSSQASECLLDRRHAGPLPSASMPQKIDSRSSFSLELTWQRGVPMVVDRILTRRNARDSDVDISEQDKYIHGLTMFREVRQVRHVSHKSQSCQTCQLSHSYKSVKSVKSVT